MEVNKNQAPSFDSRVCIFKNYSMDLRGRVWEKDIKPRPRACQVITLPLSHISNTYSPDLRCLPEEGSIGCQVMVLLVSRWQDLQEVELSGRKLCIEGLLLEGIGMGSLLCFPQLLQGRHTCLCYIPAMKYYAVTGNQGPISSKSKSSPSLGVHCFRHFVIVKAS